MNFDVTGLTEVKMQKRNGWQGSYFLGSDGECVAKHCSDCHNVLYAESFNKGRCRGLASKCRECSRRACAVFNNAPSADGLETRAMSWYREYRAKNSSRTDEQVLAAQRKKRPHGDKTCGTCRVIRPLAEFRVDRGLADGLRKDCKTCHSVKQADRLSRAFIAYWEANGIPLRCYLCDGPYEDIEHLVPTSKHGDPGPRNTRPACVTCNRGRDTGKWDTPLEEYILSVNHPTKTRAKILHEIVMSGTWPFALTTPEEFVRASLAYEEEA